MVSLELGPAFLPANAGRNAATPALCALWTRNDFHRIVFARITYATMRSHNRIELKFKRWDCPVTDMREHIAQLLWMPIAHWPVVARKPLAQAIEKRLDQLIEKIGLSLPRMDGRGEMEEDGASSPATPAAKTAAPVQVEADADADAEVRAKNRKNRKISSRCSRITEKWALSLPRIDDRSLARRHRTFTSSVIRIFARGQLPPEKHQNQLSWIKNHAVIIENRGLNRHDAAPNRHDERPIFTNRPPIIENGTPMIKNPVEIITNVQLVLTFFLDRML